MRLYIRNNPGWITFINGSDDLDSFELSYLPGTKALIGDLSTFNKPMLSKLLKLLEDNPLIDCYSSEDLSDAVFLSRFTEIDKAPLLPSQFGSLDEFFESDKSFQSVQRNLDIPYIKKLYAVGKGKFHINLLT